MHRDSTDNSDQSIGDLRGQQPAPKLFDALASAARNDAIALFQLLEERWDVSGIVLIVAVDRHQHMTSSFRNSRQQRPILADVRSEVDEMKARITELDVFHPIQRAICADIVNEENLVGLSEPRHHPADILIERQNVSFFVVHRRDDRDLDARHGWSIAHGKEISHGTDDIIDLGVGQLGEHGQCDILICITFRFRQGVVRQTARDPCLMLMKG